MALMTSIRERMHVALWTLLILFLLSMGVGGLVGGVNIIDLIFGRINPSEAIGVVNGEVINPDDFIRAVNIRVDQYRNSGQEPNERLLHKIRNEVWDNYINDILIYQQIDEMGLIASNEEVVFHLKNYPPPFLVQDPTFQTEGVFDQEKYLQAVNNPAGNEWVEIERFMKETYIPNTKLQQQIASSVVITQNEVKNSYIKENIDYSVEGIHVLGRSLKEDLPEPTTSELHQYYEQHIDEFSAEKTRNIRYVNWAKIPAQRDTNRALLEAQELINKARSGLDFAVLADQFTEDPGNQITPDSTRGGRLGWFGKKQMQPPFEEAAFAADPGEIVGPVLTRFGYHIIKIHDRRNRDDKVEVDASHILISINIGLETREQIRRAATRFSYDAKDYGFDAALDTHNVEAKSATKLTVMSVDIPLIGYLRDAVQFAFDDLIVINAVSDRLENDDHFVVVTLDSIIPAGPKPFAEVKVTISRKLIADRQKQATKELAEEVRSLVNDGLSFVDIVSDDNRLEHLTKDTKKLARGFNSIGRSNLIVGALMETDIGSVIGPLETAQGYAIIKLISVSPFDSTDFASKSPEIYNTLLTSVQQETVANWIADLKESAEIMDNRKYYY